MIQQVFLHREPVEPSDSAEPPCDSGPDTPRASRSQFEEYFCTSRASTGRRFADEIAACIGQADLHANFLISIREDAYSSPETCSRASRLVALLVTGLAAAARAAFIHGLAVAELAGLAVALAGAVLALAFLPARARPRPPELPPACDPERYPSCAKPPAGVSFLGRRS